MELYKILKSVIIRFFITIFRLKNKYLLDYKGDLLLDSNYLPIRDDR